MLNNNFRKGVGAFLINTNKNVFVAKRVHPKNAWQMPQGGIEKNESPQKAILRELLEEIGTNNVDIIFKTPTLQYLFPKSLVNNSLAKKYIGQEIIWYALLFKGKDSDINLNHSNIPEFTEWKWENPENIVNLIVDFKKQMYINILQYMKDNKLI